jgi:arylsulfatase A-like enzyme
MNRPNLLFIITEQHRGDCLGIGGHPVLQTPNIDHTAAEGVRFTRAYSTCPTCIAARRSLLSGQFPATHGMVGYREGVQWDAPPTLPGVLSEAGYHTSMVGRDIHQHPPRERYGFDHMVILADYHEWLQLKAPESGGWFGAGVTHNDWTAHPWPLAEHMHSTNWTVERALEFLKKRDPACPFFLMVSFIGAHPPLQTPHPYFDRYLRTGVPEPYIGDWEEVPPDNGIGQAVAPHTICLTGERLLYARAGYYGLLNHVDDQIRRLLNPLVSGIEFSNTIVVFTSDHGEMLGDHYRWHKIVPYEGSARIPLLIKAPLRFGINPGTVSQEPVCLEDVMPTLLEMAKINIPETVQGRSLFPLARGEEINWRSHLHIEHSPLYQSLTDGKEKYIWFVADGREQYFDLKTDPHECHDLIADPKQKGRIEYWRKALIETLVGRPEGLSDGAKLVPGREYRPTLPHAGRRETHG